jgi:hypothetical protein
MRICPVQLRSLLTVLPSSAGTAGRSCGATYCSQRSVLPRTSRAPTPIPVLTVSGAAGAKAISLQSGFAPELPVGQFGGNFVVEAYAQASLEMFTLSTGWAPPEIECQESGPDERGRSWMPAASFWGSSSILDLDFPDEHRADKRPLVEQTVSGE